MPRLDPATRRRLLTDARVARLATVTATGSPHIVPCCFVLVDPPASDRSAEQNDAGVIYSVVDGKPKSTLALKRLDNIRAKPVASLVVDLYSDDWSQLWWVRVDGSASVLQPGDESDAAIARLAQKYEQYRATPPQGSVLRLAIKNWSDWTATAR